MNNRGGCVIFLKCGYAYLRQEGNSNIQILTSDKMYRFHLKVYPPSIWRACPPSFGRVYPPSFLSTVFVADWQTGGLDLKFKNVSSIQKGSIWRKLEKEVEICLIFALMFLQFKKAISYHLLKIQ
jgi:hypothetical protein